MSLVFQRGEVRTGAARDFGRGADAFTLLELLVVMAVVAILAALVLPAPGRIHKRAKRKICLNNLRQMVIADSMYCDEHGRLPTPNDFIPSSITTDRLTAMARLLGANVPAGPAATWPKRAAQPSWFNCPMAVESDYAEGITLGGGLYTGYAYVGGIEEARVVAMGFASLFHPEFTVDARNTRRGVMWTDVLDEYHTTDARRFEFFHTRRKYSHPDFRFFQHELEGFHRAWSDGSVEWVPGTTIRLSGESSPNLRIKHLLGNFYY